MRYLFLLVMILSCFYLSACSTMNANHSQRVCKALTDNIQFQPATSNIRRAEIADTNLPLAEHDYDADGCN